MTIASALDHLTDVLANKDVAGYQTIEQSINSIADMITDGEIPIGGSIEPATADTLGGVKIGEGISVTSDGTISASGGGGYDGEILITVPESSADPTTCEAMSGTYAQLVAKYNGGEFVRIAVYSKGAADESCTTYGYVNASFEYIGDRNYIIVNFYDFSISDTTSLLWNSDGTVVFAE